MNKTIKDLMIFYSKGFIPTVFGVGCFFIMRLIDDNTNIMFDMIFSIYLATLISIGIENIIQEGKSVDRAVERVFSKIRGEK